MFVAVLELFEQLGRQEVPVPGVRLHGACTAGSGAGFSLAHLPAHEAGLGAPRVALQPASDAIAFQLRDAAAHHPAVWLQGQVVRDSSAAGWHFRVSQVEQQTSAWRLRRTLLPLPLERQHQVLEASDTRQAIDKALNDASSGVWSTLVADCAAHPEDSWLQHQCDQLFAQRWRLFDLDLLAFHQWASRAHQPEWSAHGTGWRILGPGEGTPANLPGEWQVVYRKADGQLRNHLTCFCLDTAQTVARGAQFADLLGRDPARVQYAGDADLKDPTGHAEHALSAAQMARQYGESLRAELILTQALFRLSGQSPEASLHVALLGETAAVLMDRGFPQDADLLLLSPRLAALRQQPVPAWQWIVLGMLRVFALHGAGRIAPAHEVLDQTLLELSSVTEPASVVAALHQQGQELMTLLGPIAPAAPTSEVSARPVQPNETEVSKAAAKSAPLLLAPPPVAELQICLDKLRLAFARHDGETFGQSLKQAQAFWPPLPECLSERLETARLDAALKLQQGRSAESREVSEAALRLWDEARQAAANSSYGPGEMARAGGEYLALAQQASQLEVQRNRPRAALALLKPVAHWVLEQPQAVASGAELVEDALAMTRSLGDYEAEVELLEWQLAALAPEPSLKVWPRLLALRQERQELPALRRFVLRHMVLKSRRVSAGISRFLGMLALAECALALGRLPAALRWSRAAVRGLSLRPASPVAQQTQADLLLRARVAAHRALTQLWRDREALDEALLALEQLAVRPQADVALARADWHEHCAESLCLLRRFHDAQQHVQAAVQLLAPQDASRRANCFFRLGMAHAGLGEWAKAAEAYTQARNFYGELPNVEQTLASVEAMLAQCLLGLGRQEEAQRRLRTAMARLKPHQVKDTAPLLLVSWVWIRLHEQRGETDRIEQLLVTVQRLSSRLAATEPRRAAHWHLEHASLLARRGESEAAAASVQRTLDLALLRDGQDAQGLVRLLRNQFFPPHDVQVGVQLVALALGRLWRRGPQGQALARKLRQQLVSTWQSDGLPVNALLGMLERGLEDASCPVEERVALYSLQLDWLTQLGRIAEAEQWLERWRVEWTTAAESAAAQAAQGALPVRFGVSRPANVTPGATGVRIAWHLAQARLALADGQPARCVDSARAAVKLLDGATSVALRPEAASADWPGPEAFISEAWRLEGQAWAQAQVGDAATAALRKAVRYAQRAGGLVLVAAQSELARAYAETQAQTAIHWQQQAVSNALKTAGELSSEYLDAASHMARLLQRASDLPAAREWQAKVLHGHERLGTRPARRQLERAYQADLLFRLGDSLAHTRKRYQEVLRALGAALDHAPERAEVLCLCANTLLGKGRQLGAVRLLRRAAAEQASLWGPSNPRLLPLLKRLMGLRQQLALPVEDLREQIDACLAAASMLARQVPVDSDPLSGELQMAAAPAVSAVSPPSATSAVSATPAAGGPKPVPRPVDAVLGPVPSTQKTAPPVAPAKPGKPIGGVSPEAPHPPAKTASAQASHPTAPATGNHPAHLSASPRTPAVAVSSGTSGTSAVPARPALVETASHKPAQKPTPTSAPANPPESADSGHGFHMSEFGTSDGGWEHSSTGAGSADSHFGSSGWDNEESGLSSAPSAPSVPAAPSAPPAPAPAAPAPAARPVNTSSARIAASAPASAQALPQNHRQSQTAAPGRSAGEGASAGELRYEVQAQRQAPRQSPAAPARQAEPPAPPPPEAWPDTVVAQFHPGMSISVEEEQAWAPSSAFAPDSQTMGFHSAPAPLQEEAHHGGSARQSKEIIKTLMRAQVPQLPRRWREVVVAWRGDDHMGEFRISCLVDVKAPDGHWEEQPAAPAPELPELLESLREHVRSTGGRPLTEIRLLLTRGGTLVPTLKVGRFRPDRPWEPNFSPDAGRRGARKAAAQRQS